MQAPVTKEIPSIRHKKWTLSTRVYTIRRNHPTRETMQSPPIPKNVLRDIQKTKPIAEIARTLGVSRSTFYLWKTRGIPVDRAMELSALTGIDVERIRPDVFLKR